MATPDQTERFVQMITAAQGRIYAYIIALLPDSVVAADVLQETNLVLWRKSGEFDEKQDFIGWACRIAYFQTLANLRDRGRDRMRFDDALLADVAAESQRQAEQLESKSVALKTCLSKLPVSERDLLQRRYADGGSVTQLAQQHGKTPNAISRSLNRIRNILLACIRKELAGTDL